MPNEPIQIYDPKSKRNSDYKNLTQELIKIWTNYKKNPQRSKLQGIENENSLFLKQRKISSIHSFHLDNQTWQDLQNILKELNQHSQRKKISVNSLIKSLIHLGKKTKLEKILEILKEISY